MTLLRDISRREIVRLAGLAGIGAAFAPALALSAEPSPALPRLTALVDRWTAPGRLPGLIAALGLPGADTRYLARGSDGFTDLDPLTPDSLFRIYSLTKPITGMAVMMLIDEGKLRLDQPLADVLPKYARMQVQVTADGSITDLRPAKTAITIRHLLTHTAGLGYTIIQKGPIKGAMEQAGLVPGRVSRLPLPGLDSGNTVPSLAEFADRLAEMPLVHEPGTVWSYSLGLDLLGRVIEVVSGQPFDTFLQERLFDPLGMASTRFRVPAEEARRLTTNFAVLGGVLLPIDKGDASIFLDEPPFPFGGSGLVSSPRDMDRFLLMLTNGGAVGRQRVMSAAAVRAGTGNLLPPGLTTPAIEGTSPAHFGAGGRVGIGAEAGIFGWAGAAGTVAMVDVRRGIRSAIYAQFMPSNALPLLAEYQTALRADLAPLLGAPPLERTPND